MCLHIGLSYFLYVHVAQKTKDFFFFFLWYKYFFVEKSETVGSVVNNLKEKYQQDKEKALEKQANPIKNPPKNNRFFTRGRGGGGGGMYWIILEKDSRALSAACFQKLQISRKPAHFSL